MTGFRADADPVAVPDATITAARILDASYPVSSEVWGPSHPPGTLEGEWELERNYLPWEQPEGPHPARDGQFLLIVPAGVE